ncbi:MAG: PAS domain S-box protein [Calditrichaeota bacterium]|nr:MAG: PAS domain S-box protein [Calditrichota bacterium]
MFQWFKKQVAEENVQHQDGDLHVAMARKLIQFLEGQVSNPKRATTIMSAIARYKELPATYQLKELPGIYLKIEDYLVEKDGLQKYTRTQLRKTVKYRYEPLMDLNNFRLIFEIQDKQEFLLCHLFLKFLLMKVVHHLQDTENTFLNELGEWIYRVPDVQGKPIPFKLRQNLPESPSEWVSLLQKLSLRFYAYLESLVGQSQARNFYNDAYLEIGETYRLLSTFAVVIYMLPDHLLDQSKISLLNSEQLRSIFLAKLNHFQTLYSQISEKNQHLEEMKEELQVAQDTAIESIKLFHAVLDTVAEGIITIDDKGKIILVNQHILDLFKYKEEELIGKNVQELMPPKYREQHQKGMERYIRTGKSRALGQRLNLEGLKKDGTIFPLEMSITECKVATQTFFTAAMRDISQDLKQEHEHNKTLDVLRSSEQRLRTFVENTPDIVFSLSLDGSFTYLSSAFTKVTGWKITDWIEKPFTQLIHPDDASKALRNFQSVLQGESPPTMELQFRLANEQYAFGEFTLKPQFINEKVSGAIGIARDITQQKKLQKLVRAQERTLKNLLEHSPEAIALYSREKLVYVNRNFGKLLGAMDFSQLLDKPLLELVHQDDVLTLKDYLQHQSQNGKHEESIRVRFRKFDETEALCEVLATPLLYQSQPCLRLVVREVIQPARDNEIIQGYQQQFQKLIETTGHPVLIQNITGIIIWSNSAAWQLFNAEKAALQGKSFIQFIPADKREQALNELDNLFENRSEFFRTQLLTFDGKQVEAEIRATLIDWEGKPATLISITNLTEKEQGKHTKMRLFAEVKNLQSQIKKLGNMIPVCASCNQIRDDEEYWQLLDQFIESPENLRYLRGICPTCAKKGVLTPNIKDNGAK